MPDPAPKRPFWKNPWLWGVVALVALDALFRFTPLLKRVPDPPAVVETLPEFSLTTADGAAFTRAGLDGTVHLAGFVAPGDPAGPQLAPMLRLEAYVAEQAPYERYGDELRLMLIHPAATPEELAALAVSSGLEPGRWTLLTGDADGVIGSLVTAIRTSETTPAAGLVAIIDGQGGVRGFYDATVEEGREEAFWRAMRTLEDAHAKR